MSTTALAEVTSVKPIEFEITIKTASVNEVLPWMSDLRSRHTCIRTLTYIRGFTLYAGDGHVTEMKVSLYEDADYQQLCALRAELKP